MIPTVRTLRVRVGLGVLVAVMVSFALVMALGQARAAAVRTNAITLDRCGYVKGLYGRTAVYPWRIKCTYAEGVVLASGNPKDQGVGFGPGFDGGVVRYRGSDWVCTGQMGQYNCGYPYRPAVHDGVHGYKGPFTKDVEFDACSVQDIVCPRTTTFSQP